jgi:hypothetical protein
MALAVFLITLGNFAHLRAACAMWDDPE